MYTYMHGINYRLESYMLEKKSLIKKHELN